ncbi:hypothetical protein C2W62_14070 [Candidatus Entotheonella serta]|nr:hypothetical protein C2W62_14070 [Candidatus Entotheonella serta]
MPIIQQRHPAAKLPDWREHHLAFIQKAERTVMYPALADILLGPLASGLSEVNRPLMMTPNRFSTSRPRLLAHI